MPAHESAGLQDRGGDCIVEFRCDPTHGDALATLIENGAKSWAEIQHPGMISRFHRERIPVAHMRIGDGLQSNRRLRLVCGHIAQAEHCGYGVEESSRTGGQW